MLDIPNPQPLRLPRLDEVASFIVSVAIIAGVLGVLFRG